MKWIKASEMMPMMQTRCVLKHIGANTIHLGNFDKNEEGAWLFIQCSDAHAGWSVADEGSNFENWEWLDESGSDEIEKLKEKNKQANEFICDIAKLLGEDDLGLDGKTWTIDDFKDAINQLQQGIERERELEEALRYLVNDVRNKPNDTRYATALKKANDVLNKKQ